MKFTSFFLLGILSVWSIAQIDAVSNDTKLHVLITSVPSSHYVPLIPITKELLDRGHDVTWALEQKVFKSLPHFEGAKQLILPEHMMGKMKGFTSSKIKFPFIPEEIKLLLVNIIFPLMNWPKNEIYTSLLSQIQAMDKKDRPHVIIAESFALYGIDVADKLEIESCLVTMPGPEFFSFTRISPYPKYMLPYPVHGMTLWQTTWNLVYQQFGLLEIGFATWGAARYLITGLPMVWNWNQLGENRLVLMATAPGFSPTEGLPDNFVYFGGEALKGGMTMGSSRPGIADGSSETDAIEWLNEKQQNQIDVVYVAFGTVLTPSEENVREIITGLIHPKRAILWSIKNLEMAKSVLSKLDLVPELKSNVLLKTWVLQLQVLSHPATKAFFTHGGFNSVKEGVASGKPIICRSMFGDQAFNCLRMQDLGAAVALNRFKDVKAADVKASIERINANYDQYQISSVNVGNMFRNTGGAKTAVDAIEKYYLGNDSKKWKPETFSFWQKHVLSISLLFAAGQFYLNSFISGGIYKFGKRLISRFEGKVKLE
ncbi:hypothetical protein HK098_000146 [Nowakowskiella sp. JEL0407]|nr:hypothetical protein HK098_000146 [Nowakowskiella sp. JEL0407]